MRASTRREECLDALVKLVNGKTLSSFGDGSGYDRKVHPRDLDTIEVRCSGGRPDNIVDLFERDCPQRRPSKVLEEPYGARHGCPTTRGHLARLR